jgi:putative addiction module component (TIGR02574 family)
MDFAEALSAISTMSIDDRLRLAEAIWQGIEAEEPVPDLTEAQKRELNRRLEEDDASPDDVIDWDDVNAEIKARLRK